MAVFLAGLKNGVFTTFAADAMADGFDRHLELQRGALGVMRAIDRGERDHPLQGR